jgi:hypothetical protein
MTQALLEDKRYAYWIHEIPFSLFTLGSASSFLFFVPPSTTF